MTHGDPESQAKKDTIAFLERMWPPPDSQTLYDWGWTLISDLGKIPALRAVIAAYEYRQYRDSETEFDRQARRAVEAWIVDSTESNRKHAGRLASVERDEYSHARALANMVARSKVWRTAVGVNLTGNPHNLSQHVFNGICDAIRNELLDWATNKRDPIVERMAE